MVALQEDTMATMTIFDTHTKPIIYGFPTVGRWAVLFRPDRGPGYVIKRLNTEDEAKSYVKDES